MLLFIPIRIAAVGIMVFCFASKSLPMVLGGLISLAVNKFTPIPALVPMWSVVAAVIASTVTGIFFGLYPASKASKLDPVEALRYE